jgi:hypothetical protein
VCLEIARKQRESPMAVEADMRTISIALAAIALVAVLSPARAVPPTVTPSPGYDARLQESRGGGSATTIYTPAPRPPKPKPRKQPQH